jgi:hypothetical protein
MIVCIMQYKMFFFTLIVVMYSFSLKASDIGSIDTPKIKSIPPMLSELLDRIQDEELKRDELIKRIELAERQKISDLNASVERVCARLREGKRVPTYAYKDLIQRLKECNVTPLHVYAAFGDAKRIEECVKEESDEVDAVSAVDCERNTPLHYAFRARNIASMRALCKPFMLTEEFIMQVYENHSILLADHKDHKCSDQSLLVYNLWERFVESSKKLGPTLKALIGVDYTRCLLENYMEAGELYTEQRNNAGELAFSFLQWTSSKR